MTASFTVMFDLQNLESIELWERTPSMSEPQLLFRVAIRRGCLAQVKQKRCACVVLRKGFEKEEVDSFYGSMFSSRLFNSLLGSWLSRQQLLGSFTAPWFENKRFECRSRAWLFSVPGRSFWTEHDLQNTWTEKSLQRTPWRWKQCISTWRTKPRK